MKVHVSSVEFNSKEIGTRASRALEKGLLILGFSLQKRVRKQLSREGSGEWYKGNPARSSRVGEPPVSQTNMLRNSWTAGKANFTRKKKPGQISMIYSQFSGGAPVSYGYRLEVQMGRPFLQPAVERILPQAEKIVAHVIDREFRRIDAAGPYA
tara:strand:+ start:1332 stop:1793 length:462 start_codon:yes stop_codon:yes gene_type:complete